MATYGYKTPTTVVKLADSKQRRYHVAAGDEGWFRYDDLAEIFGQHQLFQRFIDGGEYLEFGDRPVSTTIVVNRRDLKGVMLRPLIGPVTTAIAKAYYTLLPAPAWVGDYSETWDLVQSEDGLFAEMHNKLSYDGLGDPQSSSVTYYGEDAGGGCSAGCATTRAAAIAACNVTYNECLLACDGDPVCEGNCVDARDVCIAAADTAYDACVIACGGEPAGICPNGFFIAGVRRAALDDNMIEVLEDMNYADASWTNIMWGNSEGHYVWQLHIPLKGKPTLFENTVTAVRPDDYLHEWPDVWVEREWTEGELSAVTPQGMAKEGKTYKIGVIGKAIAVTESSFEDGFAYYVPPNRDQPIAPAGPMRIENSHGQCDYWLAPLIFLDTSVGRQPFYIGNFNEANIGSYIWATPSTAPPGVTGMGADGSYWQIPPSGSADPACLAGCVATWEACIIAAGVDPDAIEACNVADGACATACVDAIPESGYLMYEIEIKRGYYPAALGALDLPTFTTPFVTAAEVFQSAEVTDNGAPSFTTIPQARFGLTLSAELGAGTSQRYALTIDNRLSTSSAPAGNVPTEDFTTGRVVELSAGWVFSDGSGGPDVTETADFGQLFIVTDLRDARNATFSLTDLLGIIALTKWDGAELNFRGWNPAAAINYLLDHVGVGEQWRDIENLGLTLAGDEWRYNYGANINDIIADLADKGGESAALWYDRSLNKVRTGCKYCRTERTAGDWATHQDAGWNSTGCLAADLVRNPGTGIDLRIIDAPANVTDHESLYISKSLVSRVAFLQQGQYANRIAVTGKTSDGRVIRSTWQDDESLFDTTSARYTGMPVTYTEENSELQTRAELNARLIELAQELGPQPTFLDITMPFRYNLKPGFVAEIAGGTYAGADVNGGHYRITSVMHNIAQRETRLQMRYMKAL